MSSHEPTRYDLTQVDGEGLSVMEPHRQGDYVTFESYNELLGEIEDLEMKLKKIGDLL